MPHYDEARGLLESVVRQNTTLVADATHSAPSKAVPGDADEIPLVDSASAFSLVKITWANLKAALAAWINGTLIPASFTSVTSSGAISGSAAGVRLPTNGPVYFNAGLTVYVREVSAGVLQVEATQVLYSGLILPQQATTAGAPAYVEGAIYFDTTLKKLRVGGAAAWETVTSV